MDSAPIENSLAEASAAGSRPPGQQYPFGSNIEAVLPALLLGRCLALAGSAAELAASVPLVCRRWRDVLFSEPSLWASIRCRMPPLQPGGPACEARAAFLHRQLARMAAHVTEAALDVGIEQWQEQDEQEEQDQGQQEQQRQECAASLLQLLQPWVLASLQFSCKREATAAETQALRRLASLTSLRLEAHWSAGLAAALATLTSLQRLSWKAYDLCNVEGPVVECLLGLEGLTSLELEARYWLPTDELLQLTVLTALCHITLRQGDNSEEPIQLPAPACFPCLETYNYGDSEVQVAGAFVFSAQRTANGQLELHELMETPPLLSQLLDSLQPPAAPHPPSGLYIQRWAMQEEALAGCAHQLSAVTSLHLESCYHWQALGVLLEQVPCLKHLVLEKGDLAALPASLAALTWLNFLAANSHRLADLPDGPYLAGLQYLDLSSNKLSVLPPPLASHATRLSWLDLSCNELTDLPEGPYLAGLQHLILGDNPLNCLPPALTQATALTQLSLHHRPSPPSPPSGFSQALAAVLAQFQVQGQGQGQSEKGSQPFQLSPADVAAVLAALPRLRHLDLTGLGCLPELLELLGTQLPHVAVQTGMQ